MTKNVFLLASVFITGTAVLIVEILAIRILSPYYGNTIYTTSSVIGVILAALSLGYYIGGKTADKYPYAKVFYLIIFGSGLTILVMQVISSALLQLFSGLFSITLGPLIFSSIIFFGPAFALGTVSPIAIKLHKTSDEKLGRTAGEIFFWSTLGSICGTILSGFFLIPYFGINAIMTGVGAILSVWGLMHFLSQKPFHKEGVLIMVLLISASLFAQNIYTQKNQWVIYEKDGMYEKIKIVDGEWKGQPARFLFQDRSYSAAIYKNSDNLVYDYTKYYALYQLINPTASRALVLGGGAYSIPRALLKDSPTMQVDVAEIEPELYANAKKYFNLEENPRLHNYTEDGRRLLVKTNTAYNIIVGDAYYSLFSIPIHLTTKEFFTLAKSKLTSNGVFIGNFAGSLKQENQSLIISEMKTFKSVFENSYFFAVESPDSTKPQNVIFLGINGSKKIDFAINPTLAQKNINTSTIDFSGNNEITDNYAPIEYLVGKVISRWY